MPFLLYFCLWHTTRTKGCLFILIGSRGGQRIVTCEMMKGKIEVYWFFAEAHRKLDSSK
jgi:hypothetical protein